MTSVNSSGLYSTIWSESFWFPRSLQVGWKDIENQPGSDTYYPDVKDLHWSLVLSLVLLVIRYLWEIIVIVPIGVKLGLSNKKRKPVTPNLQLEAAFKKNKKPNNTTVQALSKQTDLTERQVEIWFRKRSQQDALTPLQKFRECSWHLVFYTASFIYGLVILWEKPYMWTTEYCWKNWPKQHVSNDIYWYYLWGLSFYWSLIFTLFKDNKRKDFVEMTVHHIATITLMYFSWIMNFVRVGSLVLLVHDAADTWLALAKMSFYVKNKLATDIFFGIFLVVWVISRLIIYPFVILYSTTVQPYTVGIMSETFGSHQFFNFFLYLLQVLHYIWTYLIFRIVYRKMIKGNRHEKASLSESSKVVNMREWVKIVGSLMKDGNPTERVLYCTLVEPFIETITPVCGSYIFFNVFLGIIQVLNLMWSYHLVGVAYRSIAGRNVEDVRSDSEDNDEESDDENESNDTMKPMQNGVIGNGIGDFSTAESNDTVNSMTEAEIIVKKGIQNGQTDSRHSKNGLNNDTIKPSHVGNGELSEEERTQVSNGRQMSPSKIPRSRRN